MADQDKAPKVSVKALQLHTHQGAEYQPGDTYDVDAEHVESLIVQGKAAPVSPEDVAPASAQKASRAGSSTEVKAMGVESDEPVTAKPAKAAKSTGNTAKTGARKTALRKKA